MKRTELQTIELAESSINDGITLGTRGLNADAIEAFEKALAICQGFKGDSHHLKILAAQALGNKCAAVGDMDRHAEAVDCYDAAVAIYRQMADEDRSAALVSYYAASMMNKGWALINLGREHEGIECHEESLGLRRELVANGHDEVLPDLARSLYNIGEGYFRTESFAKALPPFVEAEGILRALLPSGQTEIEEDLAYLLAAKADTLQMLGQLPEARDTSDEAITLFTRLARSIDNSKLTGALAGALNGRKLILRKLGKAEPNLTE